ncbi:hypothetical protein NQ315_007462 [Exocentrus adspersus]|uniref:Protein sleepless n=1 Tax=Exocentrus adspersus TaxID=1586481 RepID=A0AAV8VIE4_9CUCU|nr:hypothetical protein NQ315_007462 [Exocentrus adspersus]
MTNATSFLGCVAAVILLQCIPALRANVRCYRCLIAMPVVNYDNETIRLCKDFDYSDKFIVDCPFSTFCMKKTVSAKIPYPINGTMRGCASQKEKHHNYLNKQWQVEYTVEDPYEEGCSHLDDKGARSTTAQFCYCKGDLCNTTGALAATPVFYIISAVIVVLSMSIGV